MSVMTSSPVFGHREFCCPVRQHHHGKASAALERHRRDRVKGAGQLQRCQAGAALKRSVLDRIKGAGQLQRSQAGTPGKGILANGNNAFGHSHGLEPRAAAERVAVDH